MTTNMLARYFFFIVVLSLLVSCTSTDNLGADGEFMTVCYIPIGSGTFVPMTRKNFLEQCTSLGRLKRDDTRYRKIVEALNDRSGMDGAFDEYALRVRIAMPDGKVILIDQEGRVDSGGVYFRINSGSFLEIEKILDVLEEEVGPTQREDTGPAEP